MAVGGIGWDFGGRALKAGKMGKVVALRWGINRCGVGEGFKRSASRSEQFGVLVTRRLPTSDAT